MAPVLGPDGKPLAARGWYDTEAMARDGGTVWLGIERVNRIVRLDVGRDGLVARAQPVPIPPGIASLPHNKGIECLEFVPPGAAACARADRDFRARSRRGRQHQGLSAAAVRAWSEFSVKRIGDFDLTDCALTPKGDLLVLERSFSRFRGVAMRIRRVRAGGHSARRDDRRPGADRGRHGLSDRQHGGAVGASRRGWRDWC